MSQNVIFEDNNQYTNKRAFEPSRSTIVQFVIKYSGGRIRTVEQANRLLLLFVFVSVIFSAFLIFSGRNNITKKPSLDLVNRVQPAEGYIPR